MARVLALLTDAWGAGGGIGEYNRRLVAGLADMGVSVSALFMIDADQKDPAPPMGVRGRGVVRHDKVAYVRETLQQVWRRRWDVVLCGHVNLTPLAVVAKELARARVLWTTTHGIEVWQPPSRLRRWALSRSDVISAVSNLTRERLLAWSSIPTDHVELLYNTFDPSRFSPQAKPAALIDRYHLANRKVLLTVGRMARAEGYKGQDLVISALSEVAREHDIAYLIVGAGDDRPRLEILAQEHGVSDRVIFAGAVPDAELPDHYRVADLFVMPSRGEGFGIVYLEAAASGVPSIASSDDAGGEVVRRIGGRAVTLAKSELASAIVEMLRGPPQIDVRAAALATFGPEQFNAQLRALWRARCDPGSPAQ